MFTTFLQMITRSETSCWVAAEPGEGLGRHGRLRVSSEASVAPADRLGSVLLAQRPWWRLVNWLPMERGASRVHVQWANTCQLMPVTGGRVGKLIQRG